jgi:RNA polymerase sigma-70 factor (ECF subfamily)
MNREKSKGPMPTDLQPDRDLAERARHGDSAAWRAIYDATCDRLFAFLCYQIGDRDEAKDILQETYLQAFRRLDTWRGEAPLEVWLRAIALGRSIDWRRVMLRRLKRTVALDESNASVEPELEDVHFASEGAELRRALAKLSHHQRAALLLREWEGRSFLGIAALLGCAESTARVHHTRAREHMRAALKGTRHSLVERTWEGQES